MSVNFKIDNPERLKQIFRYRSALVLENFLLFDDYELYDQKTKQSRKLKTAENAFNYEIEGVKLSDKLADIDVEISYSGGRGSSGVEMGGGFNHANDGGDGPDNSATLPNAYFNNQGRFSNQETTIRNFIKRYANADVEYGISVDEMGFSHQHRRGGSTSVRISAAGRNQMIVHNHPGAGGNFSDGDLLSTAFEKNASGIIAVDKNTIYTFRKGAHFKANSFAKAVKAARWPKKMDYNTGADWWLTRNAAKFGYTYSRTVKG